MGIVKGKAVGKWSRPMYQEGHQAWTTIRLGFWIPSGGHLAGKDVEQGSGFSHGKHTSPGTGERVFSWDR
jgi:hypothetical protein